MRSLIQLIVLTRVLFSTPLAIAQNQPSFSIDGAMQRCERLPQEAYFHTTSHIVHICQGETSFQMIVTDRNRGSQERIAARRNGDRYESLPGQGTTYYSIDPRTLIITDPRQRPVREAVLQASTGTPTPGVTRYDCQSQLSALPNQRNVSLQDAQRLALQMSGTRFAYHCQAIASSNPTPVPQSTVSGVVTYRQRIALPPNAVVAVKLVDINRADAPAITLDEKTIITNGKQVPIPFSLKYDPQKIVSSTAKRK